MESIVHTLSRFNTGYEETKYTGLPLEDAWNICVLDGTGYANLVVAGSIKLDHYKEAKEQYESLSAAVSGCGASVILCHGSYEVDPEELDDSGNELPNCGECGTCKDCMMWEEYFKHCEE